MRQDVKSIFTISYHNIFEYPLTEEELSYWQPGKALDMKLVGRAQVQQKGDYFFIKDRERLIGQRKKRKKLSRGKIRLAVKWAKTISIIPTVRMVGLTGALAMDNARADSDVDLIIICQKSLLWTTRLAVVLLIDLLGIPRNARGKIEKDHLCLNMWLDEGDLVWPKNDRNFYTAHEIIQIVPLVNKNQVFSKLILKNSWTDYYWPKAARKVKETQVRSMRPANEKRFISQYLYAAISKVFEPLAFRLQYLYMQKKITRELVTPGRAIFHPRDWGQIVKQNLGQ